MASNTNSSMTPDRPNVITALSFIFGLLFSLTTYSEEKTTLSNATPAPLTEPIHSVVALFSENPAHVTLQVGHQLVKPTQILRVGQHWQATVIPPEGHSVEALLLATRQHPAVLSAEQNYPATLNLIPNDPTYQDNSFNVSHHQQINSEEAWDIRTDCRSVVVAIVDTGVDDSHPDLAENLWINADEIGGNGIDDDNNGYVDDVNGACVRNDCSADQIQDNFGHGSHVAGLLAAVGNNEVGVTGVCWNAELMIVKSLGDNGSGSTSDVAAGINYAVNNGADIINTSLTISNYSSAIESAIEQANQAGILVVAAAGNFNSNNDITSVYPANLRTSYDNLMSIANANLTDDLYSGSNYGLSSVDLAAPGVNLYSTWDNGQYANSTGTSMASPIVAGVAALLMAELGTEQNALDILTKARVLESARSVEALEWQILMPGIVDAHDTLTAAQTTPLTLFRAQANSGSYQLFGYDLTGVDRVRYTEFLTSGESNSDITTFQAHTSQQIDLSLPANSKSGVFRVYQGASASNQIFIKRTIAAPSNVAYERSENRITLSWTSPQNADLVTLERGVPGQVFQEIATITPPNSVYQDTIDPEQKYYYRLRGSYDYIDPASGNQATEYSTYSSTLVSTADDNENYWLTERLPTISVGSQVSLQLTATASGSFSLIDGDLPFGLSLSSSGMISGTPTTIGLYTFLINFQPTDSAQVDSRQFTLTIDNGEPGTMTLVDQQSLALNVSSSNGTLSSIQALDNSSFDSTDNVSVQLVQQVRITDLPITAAEASEISITLANASDGKINDIYLASTNNQWQNAEEANNVQVASSSASIVIEDGSEHDLDNQVNGAIIARIASTTSNNTTESDSSGGDSRCFIASAVYEPGHQNLSTLRQFRDTVLRTLPGGDWLISTYYQHSPSLVVWIQHHPTVLSVTRSSLSVVSASIRHPYLSLGMFLMVLGVALIAKKRKQENRIRS